jgi:hypothetical protein
VLDITREALLSLTEAARLRPPVRAGRPTHPSTVFRWIARGVRGHRLEAVRLGGSWFTSREALQRFAQNLSTSDGGTTSPAHGSAADAAAELDRIGL